MKSLVLYEDYTREDAHDIFEHDTRFTPHSGKWGIAGIVSIADREGDFVLFVTFGKKQGTHIWQMMYLTIENGWIVGRGPGGVLYYEADRFSLGLPNGWALFEIRCGGGYSSERCKLDHFWICNRFSLAWICRLVRNFLFRTAGP
jgi:hypothetical protein